MQEMNHNAPATLFVSMLSALMSIILMADFHTILSFLSAGVAIISGILAARYYYFAAKEKKLSIKKLKQDVKGSNQ